ncbi:VOC family protein [Methyloraptor flagellatus]|uniref:VOC family protein n=1 Tax=Methyloraptor flagellatus TaxID=3162530 RepID=A0AAU7XER6_9HYPH
MARASAELAAVQAPFWTPRGIDHLVLAVRDLDAGAETWARMGFTLTPRAEHPWGTANRLVQFPGSFLEILSVAAPEKIAAARGANFSFGAFNRDFLKRREGMSMLVLESQDTDGDIENFRAHGLTTYRRFDFARTAITPDGEPRDVAFSLAFTGPRAERDAGFFTCRQIHPENFWNPDYQAHANSATGLAEVVLVARDPADHHAFLSAFTGEREIHATGRGLSIATPRGVVSCLTPVAFRHWYGAENLPADPDALMFGAIVIKVDRFGDAAAQLIAGGFDVADRLGALVVPAAAAHGIAVAFREA